ncbi:hypothetical protein Tco_1199317 [Tanacetum coccineum]
MIKYQKEVNEIYAERIDKNVNPLALEIAKPITPPSESANKEDNDPEQAQRDKDINKNVDTSPRYKNDNQTGQFRNQRTLTVAGAKETVGSQIQEVPTADSGTDTEPLEQVQYDAEYNVLTNERRHSEQSESICNTCVVEKADSNVIPDSLDMCNDDIYNDQNTKDERAALANLIANLTLNTEENKKILMQLKKANASFTQEPKECKSNLKESNTTRDSCLISLQHK